MQTILALKTCMDIIRHEENGGQENVGKQLKAIHNPTAFSGLAKNVVNVVSFIVDLSHSFLQKLMTTGMGQTLGGKGSL